MKSKMLLALAGLLLVSMIVISPVSAQSDSYKAYGTLDEYSISTTAEVYSGFWRVQIERGNVKFIATYLELNIDEENPDTQDRFAFVLTDLVGVTVDGDVCEIEGTFLWLKIGWDNPLMYNPPGTLIDLLGPRYMWLWQWFLSVTIDPSGILIDLPGDQGIVGSTFFIQ